MFYQQASHSCRTTSSWWPRRSALMGFVDVVLADDGELCVVADAEDRQIGWEGRDRVSHVRGKIVLGHEHASTWIDVKRARMDGARLDVLDRGRLAAFAH